MPFFHFLQILNPFYVFQIFSVILWYFDEYEAYATCIILMSAISLTVSVYMIRKVRSSSTSVEAARFVGNGVCPRQRCVVFMSSISLTVSVNMIRKVGC